MNKPKTPIKPGKGKKHNIFIRVIKDDKNFLKFKGNITMYQAGNIIEYIVITSKKGKP